MNYFRDFELIFYSSIISKIALRLSIRLLLLLRYWIYFVNLMSKHGELIKMSDNVCPKTIISKMLAVRYIETRQMAKASLSTLNLSI